MNFPIHLLLVTPLVGWLPPSNVEDRLTPTRCDSTEHRWSTSNTSNFFALHTIAIEDLFEHQTEVNPLLKERYNSARLCTEFRRISFIFAHCLSFCLLINNSMKSTPHATPEISPNRTCNSTEQETRHGADNWGKHCCTKKTRWSRSEERYLSNI